MFLINARIVYLLHNLPTIHIAKSNFLRHFFATKYNTVFVLLFLYKFCKNSHLNLEDSYWIIKHKYFYRHHFSTFRRHRGVIACGIFATRGCWFSCGQHGCLTTPRRGRMCLTSRCGRVTVSHDWTIDLLPCHLSHHSVNKRRKMYYWFGHSAPEIVKKIVHNELKPDKIQFQMCVWVSKSTFFEFFSSLWVSFG